LQREMMIAPGPSLIEAARPMETPQRLLGRFPYQWLQPGPHSKFIRASGSVPMPAAYGSVGQILTYTVPQGERFSLRAVIMNCNPPDWQEGSGDVLFSLNVLTPVVRGVDYLTAVNTRLGSSVFPFPLYDGRLEFQSLDVLQMTIVSVANITLNVGFAYGMLIGHTYPNSEAS
jgi:hypothetical protein